ncbi:MAG TPA: hypothetical protein VKK31_01820 [Thermoanaerobaculia bacterium]|nr:hypothetical protein [Thermoanaerobaculia bacterium]
MSPWKAKTITMTALFAFALTAARVSAADLWLHIKVHDAKEDSHVRINLPLSMVAKTAALIPSDARNSGKIRINDEDLDVAELRQIWNEVRNRPDATYVTVDERDSKVRVAKRGEYLHIVAQEHGGYGKGRENVEMKIPIEVVSALLSGRGDEMNVGAAIQALARRGEGELVTVTGDDETVRIWVDAYSETR